MFPEGTNTPVPLTDGARVTALLPFCASLTHTVRLRPRVAADLPLTLPPTDSFRCAPWQHHVRACERIAR